MRCVMCGAGMHLVEITRDDTMMVSGYEHHTLKCAECGELERRVVFSRARRSGRNVQIVHDPRHAAYSAKDTRTGMIVMRDPDSARLRELCDWIGWHVVEGAAPGVDI